MIPEIVCPICGTHFTPATPAPTNVIRLTDARNTKNAAGDGNLLFIGNEYAGVCPWSCDGSWLLLIHQSYFALYDANGHYVRDLPFEINASSRPRWDRKNPDLFYYQAANMLKSCNVKTRELSVRNIFPEYATIDSLGEADLSEDGDKLPLFGERASGSDWAARNEVFLCSLANGKGRTLSVSTPIDSIYVTPDNNVTVTYIENGAGRFQGVELYDADMTFIRQLTHAGGHMCFARDADGSEILLWTNSNDPAPPAGIRQQSIVKVRLSDGEQTALMQIDWGTLAIDIGANAGFFFLSVYGGPASAGKLYAGQILAVNIATGEITKLCDHGSTASSYTSQPMGASSRDGKKIVFRSNMRDPTADYCDTYMVKRD